MAKPARIKDTDNGYKAMMKRLSEAGKPRVLVGVLEDTGSYENGASVSDVAMWMEFGTPTVDERSFLRAWVDERETEINKTLTKIAEGLVTGKTPNKFVGLDRFGLWAVGSIQARIADGIPPELADSTVARKGSSTPLIDRGQLRSSVTHRVENA
jgi:hypothetical protein